MKRRRVKVQRTHAVKYYLAASVALAAVLVYLVTLQNDFVNWDDNFYVYENYHIHSLNRAFFKWAFFDFTEANWHPLTWISHALDYAVWGLNPLGHHLTNVLLHAINTFLVVLLVTKLVESRANGLNGLHGLNKGALIAAGVTGLLFGLHPLHVESVAWVAERKDLLCALFFLLSTITYADRINRIPASAAGQNSRRHFFSRHYLVTLGFFVLALLSKPMAVTLPIVLLILDWYPFGRIRSLKTLWTAGIVKLPFFALSLASSVITVLAQSSGGALQPTELAPVSTRLLVAAKALVGYLGKMIWPLDLVPFYSYPKDSSLLSAEYISAIALVIGITIACAAIAKKQKLWLAAWGYYVVTLIPVIGIVQVGGQAMADRYTYLPSIGPFLVMGSAVAWGSAKIQERRGLNAALFSGAVVLLVFVPLSYLTFEQAGRWKNSLVLWNYVIEKDPGVTRAYNNRGIVFGKLGLFEAAIEDYNRAIALDPSCYPAFCNRGMALYRMGRPDKAIEDYDRAIALNPSYVEAYGFRGMAFDDVGRPDKAIEDYDKAIALDPAYYKAYNNKGLSYGKAGMPGKAIEAFNESLAINPAYADAYYNRGAAYVSLGRYDSALEDFNKAIFLNQNYATAYLDRGRLYLRTGKSDLARADFQKACELGNNDGCKALP